MEHGKNCHTWSDHWVGEAEVVAAVEVAVADSLHDVLGRDTLAAGEVGDGAGALEDAVVGAGASCTYNHPNVIQNKRTTASWSATCWLEKDLEEKLKAPVNHADALSVESLKLIQTLLLKSFLSDGLSHP